VAASWSPRSGLHLLDVAAESHTQTRVLARMLAAQTAQTDAVRGGRLISLPPLQPVPLPPLPPLRAPAGFPAPAASHADQCRRPHEGTTGVPPDASGVHKPPWDLGRGGDAAVPAPAAMAPEHAGALRL
jgi:hypothetical protein